MPSRLKPLLLLLPLLVSAPALAFDFSSGNATQTIAISALPSEVRDTLRLIKQGGPFPYPRDGIVFGNREHRLPPQQRGYYHEYTVKTPGVHNRGARRIVCGMVSEGSAEERRERDGGQGARSRATETYLEGRRESEHRATQHSARAASLSALPECYYTDDHYQTFKRIKE